MIKACHTSVFFNIKLDVLIGFQYVRIHYMFVFFLKIHTKPITF